MRATSVAALLAATLIVGCSFDDEPKQPPKDPPPPPPEKPDKPWCEGTWLECIFKFREQETQ